MDSGTRFVVEKLVNDVLRIIEWRILFAANGFMINGVHGLAAGLAMITAISFGLQVGTRLCEYIFETPEN